MQQISLEIYWNREQKTISEQGYESEVETDRPRDQEGENKRGLLKGTHVDNW